MTIQRAIVLLSLSVLALGLAACAAPVGLPTGPTPIPTLIPVREALVPAEATSTPVYAILSFPARLPSAADGQKTYAAYCAQCHGVDGSGAVPAARDFGDLDYMRGETSASFYTVVTEGRGTMPGFRDKLSSDDRWDTVFYIWRLSTSAETLATGEQIYKKDCAMCHGDDGSGTLLGSADFTNQRQMAQFAPRDLYLVVTQGKGSMPAWQSRLSQNERWAVIDYVRALAYDPVLPQAGAVAPPSSTPSVQPAQAACSPDQTNPLAWNDAAAIEAGRVVYQASCAACHGPDAKGGLLNTRDFSSAQVSTDLKANAGRNFCAVTSGKGVMPAFDKNLSIQERWQVLTYLGSVGP